MLYSLPDLSERLNTANQHELTKHFSEVSNNLAAGGLTFSSSNVLAQQRPGTPSSVSVKRGAGTLTASWPPVADAASCHITYSSDSGASWSLASLNHPAPGAYARTHAAAESVEPHIVTAHWLTYDDTR